MGIVLAPIIGVEFYLNDVVVRRSGQAPNVNDHTRGDILEFSRKSRQRLAFIANNTPVHFVTMLTLTYPKEFPNDGISVKQNLTAFIHYMRRDWPTLLYLWFLEFQRRGAPHIHILVTRPMPRTSQGRREWRFRIAAAWYRIAATGDEKHLAAGTSVEAIRLPDGARRYCVKEMAKMEQKAVPPAYRNVGRFWGCSRAVVPEAMGSLPASEEQLRRALDGWRYAPHADRAIYRVLYGVSSLLHDKLTDNT